MHLRCPRCGNDFVRPVRPERLAERLASLLALHTFACQLCAHRFLRPEAGMRYNEGAVDKRQYERVEAKFPATFVGEKASGAGMVTRLSLGGCEIESPLKPTEGMMLQPSVATPWRQPGHHDRHRRRAVGLAAPVRIGVPTRSSHRAVPPDSVCGRVAHQTPKRGVAGGRTNPPPRSCLAWTLTPHWHNPALSPRPRRRCRTVRRSR